MKDTKPLGKQVLYNGDWMEVGIHGVQWIRMVLLMGMVAAAWGGSIG